MPNDGTAHRSHHEQSIAVAAYVRRHNARAVPKTDFAPHSPIRTWPTKSPARAP
ncbi:hypothetical protein ACQEU8_19800 [Streptomyces sp. CA-250714]|uniref:hypothetical protein n=1 Tax=Streptomyces sp. CA-250714 TaxID=3240060 RepID=UPI003D94D8A0